MKLEFWGGSSYRVRLSRSICFVCAKPWERKKEEKGEGDGGREWREKKIVRGRGIEGGRRREVEEGMRE